MARGKVLNLSSAVSRGVKLGLEDSRAKTYSERVMKQALQYGLENVRFDRKYKTGIVGHNDTGKLSASIKPRLSSVSKKGRTPRGDGEVTYIMNFPGGMNSYGWGLDAGGNLAGDADFDRLAAWIDRKVGTPSKVKDISLYWEEFADNIKKKHRREGVAGTNWIKHGLEFSGRERGFTNTLIIGAKVEEQVYDELFRYLEDFTKK